MAQRQLKLGAFMRPASIHTGAWRYPGAYPDANFNLAHIKRFIQTLERGRLQDRHGCFLIRLLGWRRGCAIGRRPWARLRCPRSSR